jgi:DNA-binding transcriptional MerR regulator
MKIGAARRRAAPPRTDGTLNRSAAEQELLSIGDLADETGVAPDTIRIWERRYGKPVPVRLPSGHRRYTRDHVRWLRRVAEALAQGLRPSKVVHLDEDELDELLSKHAPRARRRAGLDRYLELVREFRHDELDEELLGEAKRRGPRGFLVEVVGPLVTLVGREWADGRLEIRHEHFVSERLEDLLRSLRVEIEPRGGPIVLLATLSGELHGLGMHMAGLVTALCGFTPRVLGTDTPNEEIAKAAKEAGASAVAISISLATGA